MNNGGPAFPAYTYDHTLEGQVVRVTDYGMTLRDYFAAKVMQAMITKTPVHTHQTQKEVDECMALTARLSYAMADAMFSERAKTQ